MLATHSYMYALSCAGSVQVSHTHPQTTRTGVSQHIHQPRGRYNKHSFRRPITAAVQVQNHGPNLRLTNGLDGPVPLSFRSEPHSRFQQQRFCTSYLRLRCSKYRQWPSHRVSSPPIHVVGSLFFSEMLDFRAPFLVCWQLLS